MKFCTFSLAIYILVLSALPCGASVNECYSARKLTEQSLSHEQHDEDHHERCSPFCICTCCHISVITLDINSFELKRFQEIKISKRILVRNFSCISNFYGSIWQPPKINV